ncbi:MAG: hypothetical protein ACXWP5_14365 [Bdellovibrionota bacterium]
MPYHSGWAVKTAFFERPSKRKALGLARKVNLWNSRKRVQSLPKAKPLTRIHRRSEMDACIHRIPGSKRYVRANSPELTHGEAGSKFENIRGRYSVPDPRETEDIKNDRALRLRAMGRLGKLFAKVAGLRWA